jgi:hypothetical protein
VESWLLARLECCGSLLGLNTQTGGFILSADLFSDDRYF